MVKLKTIPPQNNSVVDPDQVRRILDKHRQNQLGGLIAILEEVQALYGYLPEAALRWVAEGRGRSLVDVYGVANFYHSFTLEPRGKHLISVCLGTACHVRGAELVVKEFEKQLQIKVGETTPDKAFTLKTVNCLGACALGPVAVVDGHYYSKLRRTDVNKIISETLAGVVSVSQDEDQSVFPIDVSCPFCNHSLMDTSYFIEDHPAIRVTVSFGDKHGWLRLSSLYGRYNIYSEHDIPFDMVLTFFCPHCHSELIGSWECAKCKAPMIPMIVRGGGTIRICARRGCTGSEGHMLDLR
ncbi:MAG: NAD(P)H-dependent oxidoreductase subunit E [Myxococcota bacterium]|nr:NAD(P)H-dependent oxidoreductase subunit E [Myxococcota bacterium]